MEQWSASFADDVPTELFPDGLPGPGDDPTAPVAYADYDFSQVNTYSDLDYTELRATPVPVSASSLPLPTGAATEATLGSSKR